MPACVAAIPMPAYAAAIPRPPRTLTESAIAVAAKRVRRVSTSASPCLAADIESRGLRVVTGARGRDLRERHDALDLPTSLTVRAGSATGALLRARSGVYDAQGDPIAISVETGAGTATTQLGYDAFGNLAQVTTPPNHAGQVQTFSVGYDAETRTYPTTTTDGFGYTSHATYDLRFGVATSEVDTSGAELRRTLDPFGRLAAVHGPYDTTLPALSFEYLPDASPPRAITITRASAPADYTGPVPAPITTVTVADGLARAIQLRRTAVVDGALGMTTTGATSRDAVGRVTASYHPFFTPGASTGFVSPAVTPATLTAYDALDRTVSTRHPDGAIEAASYDLAVPPDSPGTVLFKITATDANGHVRETFADHLERVRTLVERPTPGSSCSCSTTAT